MSIDTLAFEVNPLGGKTSSKESDNISKLTEMDRGNIDRALLLYDMLKIFSDPYFSGRYWPTVNEKIKQIDILHPDGPLWLYGVMDALCSDHGFDFMTKGSHLHALARSGKLEYVDIFEELFLVNDKGLTHRHFDFEYIEELPPITSAVKAAGLMLTPLEIYNLVPEIPIHLHDAFSTPTTLESIPFLFLSAIIQSSYDSGMNNFMIEISNTAYDHFPYELKGTEQIPLSVNLKVISERYDSVDYLLNDAEHVDAVIEGDYLSNALNVIKNSRVTIIGEGLSKFASRAQSSIITVMGSVDSPDFAEDAKGCTFSLDGFTKSRFSSGFAFSYLDPRDTSTSAPKDCVFHIKDQESYAALVHEFKRIEDYGFPLGNIVNLVSG